LPSDAVDVIAVVHTWVNKGAHTTGISFPNTATQFMSGL